MKIEYIAEKDPQVLWKKLTERFDHQRTIVLPKARYEWMYIHLQVFKIVSEYNSELFRICSKLTLCGEKIVDEDMLQKNFPPFTPRMCFYSSNIASLVSNSTQNLYLICLLLNRIMNC